MIELIGSTHEQCTKLALIDNPMTTSTAPHSLQYNQYNRSSYFSHFSNVLNNKQRKISVLISMFEVCLSDTWYETVQRFGSKSSEKQPKIGGCC
jgi:hypothetical protein